MDDVTPDRAAAGEVSNARVDPSTKSLACVSDGIIHPVLGERWSGGIGSQRRGVCGIGSRDGRAVSQDRSCVQLLA